MDNKITIKVVGKYQEVLENIEDVAKIAKMVPESKQAEVLEIFKRINERHLCFISVDQDEANKNIVHGIYQEIIDDIRSKKGPLYLAIQNK